MTLTCIVDPDDKTKAVVYRSTSRHPLARISHSQTAGLRLWWIEPHAALSIDELHQLAQIGENLTAATFVDITKSIKL